MPPHKKRMIFTNGKFGKFVRTRNPIKKQDIQKETRTFEKIAGDRKSEKT